MENECSEWKVDVIGSTEAHMRHLLDIRNEENQSKWIGKGK